MHRLVFATQKLDPGDPVLAATVPMVRALAERVDELVVLCDTAVPDAVPHNVRVHEFGAATQAQRGARSCGRSLVCCAGRRSASWLTWFRSMPYWPRRSCGRAVSRSCWGTRPGRGTQ